jgi:hypothetical protein
MPTLKGLIDQTKNALVLSSLSLLYPEVEESIGHYRKMIVTLRNIEPVVSDKDYMKDMELVVEESEGPVYTVSGQNGHTKRQWCEKTGEPLEENPGLDAMECFGIYPNPWKEWLALPISRSTLTRWSDSQVIAHCMMEMTRLGYTEEAIADSLQDEISALEEAAEGPFISSEEMHERILSRFR